MTKIDRERKPRPAKDTCPQCQHRHEKHVYTSKYHGCTVFECSCRWPDEINERKPALKKDGI